MGLTATAALWFLPAVIPLTIYVAWNDMRAMKIPNNAVIVLLVSYGILGLFAIPTFVDYLWHWSHFIVVLLVGILLNAAGLMGAGDAKYAAAAAPMVATADLILFLLLFASCSLAGLITHRVGKYTPIRTMTPGWESWEKKTFPMGLPLAGTLMFYLLVVAIYRSGTV